MDPYAARQDAGPVATKTSLLTTMCFFQHMARAKITQYWSRQAFGNSADQGASKALLSTGYGLAGPALGADLLPGTRIAWLYFQQRGT